MDREQTAISRDQIKVVPISETKSGRWHLIEPTDAPYALCIYQQPEHEAPENVAVMALDRELSPEEAWENFHRAKEYRVVD